MLATIRQNLTLKIISILVSIFMYIYVQADRNPMVTRLVIAAVHPINQPEGLEVEASQQQVEVNVTGPKALLDHLKDSSIRAIADLKGIQSADKKSALVRINFSCSTLPAQENAKLTYDSPIRSVNFQLFDQKRRDMLVTPLYTQAPPSGFQYGKPELHPARVTVFGRGDRLSRVEQLVVNASPTEAGEVIEGDFPISPRDTQNRFVDGVTISPDTVHVSVPLTELPSSRIVTVSAGVVDLPLPPYKLISVSVTPSQVKIEGKPAKINQIFTLLTEDISIRELTETKEFDASLISLPDINFRDVDGHPLNRVKVKITIGKSNPAVSGTVPPNEDPPAGQKTSAP